MKNINTILGEVSELGLQITELSITTNSVKTIDTICAAAEVLPITSFTPSDDDTIISSSIFNIDGVPLTTNLKR